MFTFYFQKGIISITEAEILFKSDLSDEICRHILIYFHTKLNVANSSGSFVIAIKRELNRSFVQLTFITLHFIKKCPLKGCIVINVLC
jgi:hypothetical protein